MNVSISRRSRVLLLSTAYLPLVGGSELAIQNLTDRMPDYDFDLVTGRYSADMALTETIGRVRVFRAGGRLARLTVLLPKNLMPIPMAFSAWRLAKKNHYALMHAYQASQAGGASWLVKFLMPRLPLLLTLQEGKNLNRQSPLTRFFRRLIFRRADRITVISNHLAGYARERSRVPVDIIPNGVDTSVFRPHPTHHAGHVVITTSRLVPKNGVGDLIRAMLRVRLILPDASLLIVGDGPLRAELESLAQSEGVADVITFVGTVSHNELPKYLAKADVFVRPSLSEGLGSAFLEAMAMGLPVIGTPVGGIPDFLKDGQTGLFCQPENPASIADAIVRMMTDSALRERCISNALTLIQRDYSWDHASRLMERTYKSLTA